jgi:hypothetical protein
MPLILPQIVQSQAMVFQEKQAIRLTFLSDMEVYMRRQPPQA